MVLEISRRLEAIIFFRLLLQVFFVALLVFFKPLLELLCFFFALLNFHRVLVALIALGSQGTVIVEEVRLERKFGALSLLEFLVGLIALLFECVVEFLLRLLQFRRLLVGR